MNICLPSTPNTISKQLNEFYLTNNGIFCLYKVPTKKLIELSRSGLVETWSNNRPPDMKRVRAIEKYINEKGYVDGCLYFAYMVNPRDDGSCVETSSQSEIDENIPTLCCYDGNHRRLAIKETLASSVIISVMWNATQELVVEHFKVINMSVSVSLIHLDVTIDRNMKSIILEFVDQLCGPRSCKNFSVREIR